MAGSDSPPVWVHGDVTATNLLVGDGRLSAVIDFGCCAVGDPACDLTIAWTFFTEGARKALITLAPRPESDSARAREARRTLGEVMAAPLEG